MASPERFPINMTDRQRAVIEVVLKEITLLPVDLPKLMWNAEEVPLRLLPHLARALSADVWYESWSETEKRSYVRNQMIIHSQKGTAGAVKQTLSNFLDSVEVIEQANFRFIYKADLSADLGSVYDNETTEKFNQVVESVKPVRSILGGVSVQLPSYEVRVNTIATCFFNPNFEVAA